MALEKVFVRREKFGLSLRDLWRRQHFLWRDRKHKTEEKRLISAKDFTEFKMKSEKYIEIHLILWLVISCVMADLFTLYIFKYTHSFYLMSGHRCQNSVHLSVHPPALVPDRKQLQLRSVWPTSPQYTPPPPLLFYFPSHRRWSVCRCS